MATSWLNGSPGLPGSGPAPNNAPAAACAPPPGAPSGGDRPRAHATIAPHLALAALGGVTTDRGLLPAAPVCILYTRPGRPYA
jgi:hypothetical protein